MGEVVVLGSGVAGLGAAYRFRQVGLEAAVYEKNSYPGGHTASFEDKSGFVFDDGPHISFTRDERIQQLFAESVDGEYEVLQARVNNHWRGHWIKHPAQCNLYGLPVDLITDILRDFVDANSREAGAISNYEEWLLASFGRTFATTFPMEYARKYHTAAAREMSTDWLGPRLYRPKLEEVLKGALEPDTVDVHYVDHFRYPTRGGFQAYLKRFLDQTEIQLEKDAVAIDPKSHEVRFRDGSVTPAEAIVSSVPLPALIRLIEDVPESVLEASGRLAASTCVLVNLGVDREDLSDTHWTYFYDRDYTITRVSFPHMFSPNNAPQGAGSIQAEIYFSPKYRPLTEKPETFIQPTIEDLRRCGLLAPDDRILFERAWVVPWANVIFDHDRADALAVVHGYLEEIGVAYCGRYGCWGYEWTDESFVSGEQAAQKVADGLRFGI